jgi:DNA-binding transcriptional LysR family regulator
MGEFILCFCERSRRGCACYFVCVTVFLDIIEEGVDVAIRFERPTNTAFVAKRLIADPWVVCASPPYLAQFGMPEQPADFGSNQCLAIHKRRQSEAKWSFIQGGSVEEQWLRVGFLA